MSPRTVFAAAIATCTLLVAGCNAGSREYQAFQVPDPDFSITFSFEASDALTNRSVSLPLTITTTVPGWADDITNVPSTPAGLTVNGRVRPQAEHDVVMSATVIGGTDSTLLHCSWTASTRSGPRSSERSWSGEGQGTGRTATAVCTYKA